jgi:hypothetical protein
VQQLFASLLQWIPDTTHTIIITITITTTSHHYIIILIILIVLSFSSHTSACMNCIFVHSFSLSLYSANIQYMFAVFPSFIHSYINGYLPLIYMKSSRPNACKCNVNLFRFVIVLFSKVVRQWGICNIFFYIIYSIYDTILSASSTYLQAPVTFPAGTTYVPAGPFCSYLFPSCRTLLQLPVPFLQLPVPFLQLPVPFLQDPSAGPSCRTLLQLPVAFLQVHVAFLQVLVAFLQVPVAFLQVPVAFLQEPCPQDPPAGPSCRTLLQVAKLTCRNLLLPAGSKKIPQYPKMVHRGGSCCLPAGTMPTACGFRILLLQLGDTFY